MTVLMILTRLFVRLPSVQLTADRPCCSHMTTDMNNPRSTWMQHDRFFSFVVSLNVEKTKTKLIDLINRCVNRIRAAWTLLCDWLLLQQVKLVALTHTHTHTHTHTVSDSFPPGWTNIRSLAQAGCESLSSPCETDDISQLVWFTCLIWYAWTHHRWGGGGYTCSLNMTEIRENSLTHTHTHTLRHSDTQSCYWSVFLSSANRRRKPGEVTFASSSSALFLSVLTLSSWNTEEKKNEEEDDEDGSWRGGS